MAPGKISKKHLLAEWLQQRRPPAIDEGLWAEIRSALEPVSESYLRRLLRDCGLPLSPLVEGVRQDSPASLKRTLLALSAVYEEARRRGDRERMQNSRQLVITAKEHARMALLRAPDTDPLRQFRQEAVQWMLVWLENPEAFPAWVRLRLRVIGENALQDAVRKAD